MYVLDIKFLGNFILVLQMLFGANLLSCGCCGGFLVLYFLLDLIFTDFFCNSILSFLARECCTAYPYHLELHKLRATLSGKFTLGLILMRLCHRIILLTGEMMTHRIYSFWWVHPSLVAYYFSR